MRKGQKNSLETRRKISEYAKTRIGNFDINNGLTLCKECHFDRGLNLHKGIKHMGGNYYLT